MLLHETLTLLAQQRGCILLPSLQLSCPNLSRAGLRSVQWDSVVETALLQIGLQSF